MEDTLRETSTMTVLNVMSVLILVLMEDTLRAMKHLIMRCGKVLILVLMEDTLRVA